MLVRTFLNFIVPDHDTHRLAPDCGQREVCIPVRIGDAARLVDALVAAARRTHEYWVLAGEGDEQDPYEALVREFERGASELRDLQDHIHTWNEYGYCDVCGVDGRA